MTGRFRRYGMQAATAATPSSATGERRRGDVGAPAEAASARRPRGARVLVRVEHQQVDVVAAREQPRRCAAHGAGAEDRDPHRDRGYPRRAGAAPRRAVQGGPDLAVPGGSRTRAGSPGPRRARPTQDGAGQDQAHQPHQPPQHRRLAGAEAERGIEAPRRRRAQTETEGERPRPPPQVLQPPGHQHHQHRQADRLGPQHPEPGGLAQWRLTQQVVHDPAGGNRQGRPQPLPRPWPGRAGRA